MKTIAQAILLLFTLALCQTSGHAQSSWTTPVRINPTTTQQQDFQRIAIGPQRQIAVACREGNITGRMAVYRSTDNGTTFLRTQIATPPVPKFEMRRTEALEFDADGNLYLLWSWNEEPLVGPGQWLVLSKSTDGGVSFSNIWSNAQLFVLNQHKMFITLDRTIHIVRDSLVRPIPPPPQNANKIIYTRLIHGNPANKIEVVLPQPGDTVYAREYASLLVAGSVVHYAANGNPNVSSRNKLYYSRSNDSGTNFSPMVQVDTGLAVFPSLATRSNRGTVLLYAVGEQNPNPHAVLMARNICDTSVALLQPFKLGPKWISSDPSPSIVLLALNSHNCLVYGGADTNSATAYYQYGDLQLPPTDSVFFPLMSHPDFAIDSLGGKYIVASHQRDFRLYFTKKDVVVSVAEKSVQSIHSALFQNYPNPFNPNTTIAYTVAPPQRGSSNSQKVKLALYDLLGRQIGLLVDELKEPGSYKVVWNPAGISSGVYFSRLEIGGAVIGIRKLLFLQ